MPGGAFRGFGGPQGHFIAEMQINKLAEALGMDPVELRLRNCWHEGSIQATRSVVPPGVTIDPVLRRLNDELGMMKDESGLRTIHHSSFTHSSFATSLDASTDQRACAARGMACCFKNVGFSLGFRDVCHATVELYGDSQIERAVVRHAAAEVGQGTHTVIAQVAAETLGVPMERIELIVQDTAETGNSGSVSASRMTFMAGNSVKGAAEAALAKWQDEERPAIAHFEYVPRATTPYDHDTGAERPQHHLWLLRAGGRGRGRSRHRPRPRAARDLGQRRGHGHQPAAGRGPDRGRRSPSRWAGPPTRTSCSATAGC